MKIKTITSQSRRDFTAILECEHCAHEQKLPNGYDDDYFHREVIPRIECGECGKTAPENYRPLATRHAAHEVV
jgi:Zn ribbon nucleic-acid-binding protein